MNKEELNQFVELGLRDALIPLSSQTKKPIPKRFQINGKADWCWKKDPLTGEYITYSDEDLLKATRIGINHEASELVAVDGDAPECSQFMSTLPPTLTVTKGNSIRQKLYKVNGYKKTKKFKDNKDKVVVEVLTNTQSWLWGDGKNINNVKPAEIEFKDLLNEVKNINAWSVLFRHMPPHGSRDDFYLALAGFIARDTEWSVSDGERFVETLAERTGDDVNKVSKKISAQKNNLEEGKTVWGVKELSKVCKVNLPCMDELKAHRDSKDEDLREYPLIDGSMLTEIKYPKVEFIMEPIFSERSTTQIFGDPESGKTLFGQACTIAMSSGHNFVGFKSVKRIPTLYVEGELSGDEFRSRRDTIVNNYSERTLDYNSKWCFSLTKDDLEMHGLKYGFDPIAVSRNLSDKDKKDYGRKGRELIENLCQRIEKQTNIKPFFILDNITVLADIDENRQQDWTPFIQWTIHMKTKGFPNAFDHHANKSTGTSSGSGAKERMLDTSICFEKLKPDQRFEMTGAKNLQCRVSFTKARNFGGSKWDLPFILTMDESGQWSKYPDLKADDFVIIELFNKGFSVKEMEEDERLKIKEKTIYKRIAKLKKMEVIKDVKGNY